MSILQVRNVSKAYDGTQIIENVSLTLGEGELVCLLGVSGVGKSTLFQIVSGLIRPDSGSVELDGRDITGKSGEVSYMLQKDLLLPFRTVEDNVALPLLLKGMKKSEAREAVRSHLAQFGLEGAEKKYPAQVSGGMRQRAALLRTYLFSQKVALLDEPFSALDTITKRTMHGWYLQIMEEISMSTLLISHDIDEAILLADRVCLMTGRPGRITCEIPIPEPKPRSNAFTLTDRFLDYKREILRRLGQNS